MFFFIALGSGIDTSYLENAACSTGGIFVNVADNDEESLENGLSSFYQYLAAANTVNEVQPTRWSEPYTSIPNIWG